MSIKVAPIYGLPVAPKVQKAKATIPSITSSCKGKKAKDSFARFYSVFSVKYEGLQA